MIIEYQISTMINGIISRMLRSGLISTKYDPVTAPVATFIRGSMLIYKNIAEMIKGRIQNHPCRLRINRAQAATARKHNNVVKIGTRIISKGILLEPHGQT
jgi:hypothetical protein